MSASRTVTALAFTSAVLAAAIAAPVSSATTATTMVKCGGINACKGQGDCKTAENACKGQNFCKGHGFVSQLATECAAKGGVPLK